MRGVAEVLSTRGDWSTVCREPLKPRTPRGKRYNFLFSRMIVVLVLRPPAVVRFRARAVNLLSSGISRVEFSLGNRYLKWSKL
jgi:hypothetical protein